MSGGFFDYNQYKLNDIADDIRRVLNRFGEEYYQYSEETRTKFEETIKSLETTAIMVQRIDWLLEGDDNEETFHKRWKAEVECK